jgi:Tfp pilus assembly protein PilN
VALSINLLHEKHKLERQRQRDPLKLGVYVLAGIVACFLAYYLIAWAGSQGKFNRRDDLRAQWEKKQREAAQVTQAEVDMKLTAAASTALSNRIEKRFFWGPVLDLLYRTVPPEVQVSAFNGSNPRRGDFATVQLDGTAVGTEPRAAAEKFRNALIAALGAKYRDVTVSFRQLEEQPGVTLKLEGQELPTARFTLDLKLRKPSAPAAPTPTPPPRPKPKG